MKNLVFFFFWEKKIIVSELDMMSPGFWNVSLAGRPGYKYVWDEWYGAFLSSSIMAFLSSPQILAQVLRGGFERLEDTERYGSSLASSLSPKGTERKKGSNASIGYENANLIFLEV